MPEVRCRSVNISEGGMAVSAVASLNVGEDVQVQFTLPDHKEPFLVNSTICWLKTGDFGVRFVSLPLERKSELQEWLSRKLEEAIPESVARQYHQGDGTARTHQARQRRRPAHYRVASEKEIN